MRKGWLLVLAAALFIVFAFWYRAKGKPLESEPSVVVSSFEECVAAGNPTQESYPPQCKTRDGQMFTQDIGNALDMQNTIVVDSPRPGVVVTNPIVVQGKARGTWFFEASFPATVLDANGNLIGQIPIQAEGDWMTEDFVPFSAEVPFSQTGSEKGTLVLHKDNPSGLPKNDAELRVPIRFKR